MSYNLCVVAHPDDETLFFSGPILNLRDLPWTVVCVTWNGMLWRKKGLKLACERLGVNELRHWDFPDNHLIPLPSHHLIKKLRQMPPPASIFTHNAFGEYGHLSHKNVHSAVLEAFQGHQKVYSVAYTNPELTFPLNADQLKLRAEILGNCYRIGDTTWTRDYDSFSASSAAKQIA